MIREFAIPASPARARRLMQLANVAQVSLNDTIREMVDETLDLTEYALSDKQAATVQRLLDYELRAILPYDHEENARISAFTAARIAGVTQIVICTRSPRRWWIDAEKFGFSVDTNPNENPDVLLVDRDTMLKQAVIEPRRDGLLIMEQYDRNSDNFYAGHACNVGREFARMIVVADFRPMTAVFHSWTRPCDLLLRELLEFLWPKEALSVLDHSTARADYLRRHGFRKVRPADLYPLFNVIFDLLGEATPS